ncbi:MAG: UvrD-helicase domain-containing protein [Oscillospiraceae bacterium]|nr:UvrD-helicase domain-containing protein [Oscillospiraceae bacterium]
MPEWTREQLQAMAPADRLTVVSAAAGSGKTTVLVARALNLLLDEQHPVSAEKMVMTTFSNASAAEFKNRIEKGINEKIRENPQNNYIKMQKVALQKANISTIHSFCIKLVRENFQSLDISPDFTICDEAQSDALHNLAIDRAMNYGYTLPDFKTFVSFYGKSSRDNIIREFLRQMDYFFSALPHPAQAAAKMAEEYGSVDMKDSPAFDRIMKSMELQADYLVYLAGRMEKLYMAADFEGYDSGIPLVKNQAAEILAAVQSQDLDKLKQLTAAKAVSLGRAKPKCAESVLINEKIYTDVYKKQVKIIAGLLEYLDGDQYRRDMDMTKRYVDVLFTVYLKYQEILLGLKKERKMFEFSDFEHFALQLLQNDDGTPTSLALGLRDEFEYIMEDEFQDTSYVQDAIFTMLAKENQKNLYVVGDVKQSIYGFRKASPQIFLDKRQIGLDDGERGNTIFLPHNFRSSYSVIEGVNYIFRRLMSKDCGGVDYDEHEELRTKKAPDDTVGVKLNIYAENEVENVTAEISRMIKEGYEINDNGTLRPVQSGDFAILLRDKAKFGLYKDALEKLGYEAFVRDDELILQKQEIQSIINLMRVVANPLQEVYLTATMFGDLFDFTLDDILKIRSDNPKINLYKALALSPKKKAADLLAVLKDLTYIAGVYSADKLIDYICKKTGYYSKLSFSEDGVEKRENIRWFIDFARNWAKTHPSDLAAFLRRVDMYLEKGKGNNPEGQKNNNAISIMTMHTSKGLEFPVCFVPGLDKKFNTWDSIKRLLLDTQLGIGMYANSRFGYNNSTLNIHAIKAAIKDNMHNEEMRLLYVAFTRSKNLLVLSAQYSRNFSQSVIDRAVACTDGVPHPAQLQNATCPAQWLAAAFSGHPAIADMYSFGSEDRKIPQTIEINFLDGTADTSEAYEEDVQVEIQANTGKIMENLAFVYPHTRRTKLPIKMSVSEISKSTPLVLAKPDFIKGEKASAAEKGTAMHRFAQHVDILLARTDLETELARLENSGMADRKLLNIPAIEKFIFSDVADMILNSEKVYTEKDFLVPYNAAQALADESYSDDEVLIQGVMDCVLQNGDEITIIDYKTDFIYTMDTLFRRYEKQLELYRYGAKQLFGTDKVKCILYSFCLDDYMEF